MAWYDADSTGGKLCQKYSMVADEAIDADGLAPGELALQAADGRLVYKNASGVLAGFPGSTDIHAIVSLTQAAYDALTPDANTLYVIT
jgi:hypothetical protein